VFNQRDVTLLAVCSRSRLDLLRVDVTVVDNAGAPVRDLAASDFLVTVDGQRRRVSLARFYARSSVFSRLRIYARAEHAEG